MALESIRRLIRSVTNKMFASPMDVYMKRTRFGEFNEFFKRMIVTSDRNGYAIPLLGNPFRERAMMQYWAGYEDSDAYNYLEEDQRAHAERRFNFMHDMIRDRIDKDTSILDVGCNSGFFLERFHELGYTNLHGIDPQKAAVALARETRPFINMTEGFFGPRENDIPCDLMIFFGVYSRIPYHARLFEAIGRQAKKYVLMWNQESLDDFIRDMHVGMAREGYLCIEKRVVDEDFQPVTFGDEPLCPIEDGDTQRPYHSYFLFRRIEVKK